MVAVVIGILLLILYKWLLVVIHISVLLLTLSKRLTHSKLIVGHMLI